jgi:hypothetical protein
MRSGQGISVYATYFRSFYYYSSFATCFGLTVIFRQKYIHWKLTTDNGSIVFRILVNLVVNDDRFLVIVDMVAVAELTIVYCRCTGSGLFLV